ncbi:succinic semialdehyde dehydrogenase, partial [Sinorhizobium meliloti CCNWSX0020]
MALTPALTRHIRRPKLFASLDEVTRSSGQPAGPVFDVSNPSTGELLATLPDMGIDDARTAIDAAALAQPLWAGKPAKDRSIILRRWHDLIVEHADDLAAILTAEMGKPLGEAKGEVLHAASYVEWYAEEAKRVYGETFPAPANDRRMLVIKQPVGVVGTITPWNFPASMVAR